MIQATNIRRKFSIGRNDYLEVLKGISLGIEHGEVIAIVGPSGAGKSTLLHILGLLDRPTEGELIFEGEDVFTLKDETLARLRNQKIGFIFQFHHLLPEFTALENVMMPALIAGHTMHEVQTRAKELLTDVGVIHRAQHKPNELSGGEQQRVAVARALMNSPKLVLADEPSGNLDSENASALHEMILDLRNKYNQTFVIVTHNKELADMADREIMVVDGLIDRFHDRMLQ
ncbi:MAG: ABC transporter ATP-binding protein [Acidobacteriota bacterium]